MQQPDDVEVFTGETLELAMSAAVRALGDDLAVAGARKVRRGLPGLRGKEHFEVVASRPAARDLDNEEAVVGEAVDVVDSAFAALLAQAEEAEQPLVVQPVRVPQQRSAPHPAPEVVVQPVLPAAPRPEAVRPAAPARPAPPPRTKQAARPKAAPRKRPAAPSHGWSRRALTALGVPRAVLAELPATDPTTDLGWVRAVERAVARVVPAPATLGPDAPVLLAAYGVEGVVQMLRTAVRTGTPPGVITLDGTRVAPATPTEIALALRSALVGERQ